MTGQQGGLVRRSRFQNSFICRDVRVLEFLNVGKVLAFNHRDRVSKHFGDILDQCTLTDVPHGARIAELVRMRSAASVDGLLSIPRRVVSSDRRSSGKHGGFHRRAPRLWQRLHPTI